MNKLFVIFAATCLISYGCASTKAYNVDKATDTGHTVLSLDYRDFDYAIKEMVQSLLDSGVLQKTDGSRYVATTGEIINDTTQRIDTRQLMSSVEEQLIASGQIEMTSTVGDAPDFMLEESRDLRESDEFDPETLMPKGQLIAPNLSFSGKIFQRVISYDKKRNQVEYYIELIATDLKTGLRFWQKQVQILKRGGKKNPIW